MSYKGYSMERIWMGDCHDGDSFILISGLQYVRYDYPPSSVYDAMKLIDEEIQLIADMDDWSDQYLI